MTICFKPIGWVRTDAENDAIPHFYAVSDIEGTLEILPQYEKGLMDLRAGQRIAVLFHFDRSADFSEAQLLQIPRKRKQPRGIFSICSPQRPNPIGLSVLEVLAVDGCKIRVKGLDMFDGTPILDIKPHTES